MLAMGTALGGVCVPKPLGNGAGRAVVVGAAGSVAAIPARVAVSGASAGGVPLPAQPARISSSGAQPITMRWIMVESLTATQKIANTDSSEAVRARPLTEGAKAVMMFLYR